MNTLLREIATNDWITIVLLICVALLATAKLMNSVLFTDFIMLFNTNKYLVLHHKENKLSSLFNSVLLLIQTLSISLFLCIIIDVFKMQETVVDVVLFLKIAGFYAVLLLSKLFVEKIIATLFVIEKLIENYLFYKISYRNFLGVLVLPFNLIFIYSTKPSEIVLIVILLLLLLLNLIILISIYKKNENIILDHLFYFILYLCALEIAPYFILYKLII